MCRAAVTERIEAGDEVPQLAVAMDQIVNACDQSPLGVRRLTGMGAAGRLIACRPGIKAGVAASA